MKKNAKIYIAGHHGMVGSAIHRRLQKEGYRNFALKGNSKLDLRDPYSERKFFEAKRLEYVFLAEEKVGGIHANNTLGAEFINDNFLIQTNFIHKPFVTIE